MNTRCKLVIRTVSTIMMLAGLAMLPSLAVAAMDGDNGCCFGIGIPAGVFIVLGACAVRRTRKCRIKIANRESYLIVLLCWFTVIVTGIFPYLLSGRGYSPGDCIFESAASWTTSSAFVIDINSMPRALVLWRATSSWLGGIAVVLLAILVIAAADADGKKLAGAEIPGRDFARSTGSRQGEIAEQIFMIYAVLSAAELGLLMIGRIPFFEALINAMSTISTSGLMDYHGAVAGHFGLYVKAVLVVFSVLASLNFAIYLNIARRRFRLALSDIEMRVFLGLVAGASLLIAAVLMISGQRSNVTEALIDGLAGTVSFGCTSGFPLERVSAWPSICKVVLIALMMIGGSSNSTASGIKVIRFVIFVKLIIRGMYRRIHPRAMRAVTIKKKPLSASMVSASSAYVLLFLAVYLFSCIVISLQDFDMETTLTAPLALLTNTGVGFGRVAGADYSIFSMPLKLYGTLLMLAGRIEMYAVLIVFSRAFWSSDRAR